MCVCDYNLLTDFIGRFEKVPLVTPNGDVLVKELSFEVCISPSHNFEFRG